MKKAFTMIELMVVVAIVAVLSIVLLPKATQAMAKAKQTGTDKNQQFLEGMVRTTLDKHYYSAPTAEEVVQRTYTQLSKNEEVVNLTNPFDKTRKGIGLIEGDTFTDTNKAAYIFTDTPNLETLPDGTAYVLVKDARLVTSTVEEYEAELKVVTTAKGTAHTLAIGEDGNLYTWGSNIYGQLGTGDTTDRAERTLITLAEGVKPVSVTSYSNNSMAIGDDGNIYVWGYNTYGFLGTGDTENKTTPTKITLPSGNEARQLYTEYNVTYAIDSKGNLYMWGFNTMGTLGDGSTINKYVPTLVVHPDGVKFKTISRGREHTLAIGTDGNLYAWGSNLNNTLGLGRDVHDKDTPTLVTLSEGVKPLVISADRYHSAAIGDDGNLYTWGENSYDQLGTGDYKRRFTPTLITLPGNAKHKSVTTGYSHTEVITTTGETIILGTK